jgi:hypothetical protein
MADPLRVFDLGQLGVQLVRSPLHQKPATEVIRAQNAIYDKDERGGGLRKRGGMTKLNSVALAGGAANGALYVAFADPGNPLSIGERRGLYVFGNGIQEYSPDLSAWTPSSLAQASPFPEPQNGDNVPFNTEDHSAPHGVSLPGRIYFRGYVGSAAFAAICRWNGTQAALIAKIPAPWQSGAGDDGDVTIKTFFVVDNTVYLATGDGDPGAAGGNALFGRVFKLDPETETLTQIGTSAWGSHSGGLLGGAPMALAWFSGRLWAAGGTLQSGVAPRLYSIRPGVDEDWTLEETGTAAHSYTSMAVYKGELYYASRCAVGTASRIRKRTAAGVYSTVRTNASTLVANSYAGLEVVNDLLVFYERDTAGSGGDTVKLFSYDGSAFTERLDVRNIHFNGTTGDLSVGNPVLYDGAVYWPFSIVAPDDGSVLLKSTNGTSWSVLDSSATDNLYGILGVLRD